LIETCLWDANDDDYADIDKRTQTLERIAQKPGNKYTAVSRRRWTQLLF